MEDTETEYNNFHKLLKKNMNEKHPGVKLPKTPYFLKSCRNERASSILTQLLYDSKFVTDDFINKATQLLLLYRSENDNQTAKLASLMQENLDIREHLKKIKEPDSINVGTVKLIDGSSDLGPLSITVELGEKVMNIEKGEQLTGNINLKNDIEIQIFTQKNEEPLLLDHIFLYFGVVLEDTHYLCLVNSQNFSKTIEKANERYKIVLELSLHLSSKEKREILLQSLYENEVATKNEQETENLYSTILSTLGIAEKDNELASTIANSKRECCDCCLIL